MYDKSSPIAFIPILLSLQALENKYQKPYSYPSQRKLLKLQEDLYGLKRCRRTLNRQLRWLEDNRFINRTRRIRTGNSGRIEFHSTLYTLRKKALKLLKFIARPLLKFFQSYRVPPTSHNKPTEVLSFSCSPEIQRAEMAKMRAIIARK